MFRKSVCNKLLPALLYLLSGIFFNNTCYSQNIIEQENPNEQIFLVRTKQFNEFLDRFNYKSNFNGDPIDSLFATKISRDQMLNSLFDLKDKRIQSSDKEYSEEYIKIKESFINEVCGKNLLLEKHSSGIIAEAKTRVTYKGESHLVRLFLNTEKVGNTMYKWVLLSARGDILDVFKEDSSMVRFIPPASNETDFINLRRALDDTDHLQYYASNDYKPDLLTIFFFCINSGLIKYEYVEEVIYHIINIPGWYIKVQEFNRNEMNSGWLISDITRNTATKINFLETL